MSCLDAFPHRQVIADVTTPLIVVVIKQYMHMQSAPSVHIKYALLVLFKCVPIKDCFIATFIHSL